MQDFRNLKVWKAALSLTLGIYKDTRAFPEVERYGLTSQLRRAGLSIGSNIAEGCGRGSDADFARFLHIALGSANEVHHGLIVAAELRYIEPKCLAQHDRSVGDLKRMLWSLIQKLKSG